MTNYYYHKWIGRLREDPSLCLEGRFGLEKENLRVTNEGFLDNRDHPIASDDPFALFIVKDFSESQIELVTAPLKTPQAALDQIKAIQDHILTNYDVRLWPFSMPCRILDETTIRIAEYDDTEEGRSARAYREMLAEKHGKKMQLISGVHYNFSFGDRFVEVYRQAQALAPSLGKAEVKNHLYFHVARNIFRYQWLLTYLFGASPFVDVTYKEEVVEQLKSVESRCQCSYRDHTYYEDFSTSLRMSRYGYHSEQQEKMYVSYDNLASYTKMVRAGIVAGILQKESEYYAPVRFKHSMGKSSSMLDVLEKEGVEYLELRLFDLNPFDPYNITSDQLYLTHLFLIYAAFKPSPNISIEEMDKIYTNGQTAAVFGRKATETVYYLGKKHRIRGLGEVILSELMTIANQLDEGNTDGPYVTSVEMAFEKLWHKEALISERLMTELFGEELSFQQQGIKYSVAGEGRKNHESRRR